MKDFSIATVLIVLVPFRGLFVFNFCAVFCANALRSGSRPLSGIICFQLCQVWSCGRWWDCSRPLSGIICFQQRRPQLRPKGLQSVLVPFRGLFVFNNNIPTPAKNVTVFSSPFGDYLFSTRYDGGGKYNDAIVLVPFRGLFVFNACDNFQPPRLLCSRPLSGIICFQLILSLESIGLSMPSSRPLSGIICFQLRLVMLAVFTVASSRPLSGIICFQQLKQALKAEENALKFSSPFGDYLFSTGRRSADRLRRSVLVPFRGLFVFNTI